MNSKENCVKRRYVSNVRVGNWNEDLYMKQYKIEQFMTKRENGQLFIQKLKKLFSHLLKDIQLEPPCSYIRFGAIVQLVAPYMPRTKDLGAEMCISIVVDANDISICQQITEKSYLSLASNDKPCARNSFVIISPDSKDRTNEILKYDQDFCLQCVDAECQPLVVFSSPKTFELQNVAQNPRNSYKNGEVNQAIGLCLRQDYCCASKNCLPEIPQLHSRWKCLNVVPNIRIETEGEPVPSNEPLVIAHSATNKCIAGEEVWSRTFFGMECGLSVTTYQTVQKIETNRNIWLLRTNVVQESPSNEME